MISGGGFRCSSALCLFKLWFLETAFFNVQTIREIKIENKKLGGKKRFPQFLLSMYVFCLCVCVFVCVFVCHRSTDFIVWHRSLKFWHRYLYQNISKWYLLPFWIFAYFWSYSPFSFYTISFILKLLVNMPWRPIHQIEAWD